MDNTKIKLAANDVIFLMNKGKYSIPYDFLLEVIVKVIIYLIQNWSDSRIQNPGFLDRLLLKVIVAQNTTWKEYREHGKEMFDALLQWMRGTSKMSLEELRASL